MPQIDFCSSAMGCGCVHCGLSGAGARCESWTLSWRASGGTFLHHNRSFTVKELSNSYDTPTLLRPHPRFRPFCASAIQRIRTNCSHVLKIALLVAPVRSGHSRHSIHRRPSGLVLQPSENTPFNHHHLRRRLSRCRSLFGEVLFGDNHSIVLLARHFRCDNKPRWEIQKQ
jgi:hypothetical protein